MTSIHNKLVQYANRKIIKYSESFPDFDKLPSVVAIVGEANYCGMLVSYGEIGDIQRAVMVLCHDEIANLAVVDGIPLRQAIDETIYHEWMHFVHAMCHPDDYDLLITHKGELWDDLITIGLEEKWITRKSI